MNNYWDLKNNNNINSFNDLVLLKNKLSILTYNNIYNMLEWNLLEYDEKINYLKYSSIYYFLNNTNKINSQEKEQIKLFAKTQPYIIDWLLENQDQIFKDLNISTPYSEIIYFLIDFIKTIKYDFNFKINKEFNNKISDQWNIKFLNDENLFNFIGKAKKNKWYASINYLFDENSTLESISKDRNLKVTRERIRQIINKEVERNNLFFERVYDLLKRGSFSIEKLNRTAIKLIERKLYPEIKELESILFLDYNFQNEIISNFKDNSKDFLDFGFNNNELKLLINNNYIVLHKGNFCKVDEKYWGEKNFNLKKMLLIFLKLNYNDTQILNKSELQKEFSDFLLENGKIKKNEVPTDRAFDALIARINELLYYDKTKLVVSLDGSEMTSEIANKILVEFINMKKQGVIMVSTNKFLNLFNNLTNYKFLDVNPEFIHNFLKKNSTIENKEKYFSRMPLLINAEKSNIVNIFYEQVQILFKETKVINWDIFLDVLKNENGFEKTLVLNYISEGNKYFMKNKNNIFLL